ncbi:MAG TPA: polyprenyl synthetase family protein [Sedimentisphaerales bacterium]|jgi:geranylgeranyl pyrophosphate synthase|nr:polyprenyl synthetase family protein [Sedimentisphaerales bacterium]HNU31332.1 polyprenyl synthetase family protein [Sedimentisphaerales bacterium]
MSSSTAKSDFSRSLDERVQIVNDTLDRLLAEQKEIPEDLRQSLQYTLSSPGKRIRSALVLWCCELVAGRDNADARLAAAAIEMVHTYSLVHDDLPAMDDDDLRRGRPTCHKAFDEATAILTGDGLLTLAFEVLADGVSDPSLAVNLVRELARAAGPAGMVAGQVADLRAENKAGTVEVLEYIHTNKTAKMFRCATLMGAWCGGASAGQRESLGRYGLRIGLGFQIADDILDVSASSEQLGKTAGKDVAAAKCTYPAVVGIEKARELAHALAHEAVAELEPFGASADVLRHLATALLDRNK